MSVSIWGRTSHSIQILVFLGEMDEVRVWNVARTAEEIGDTMNRKLEGNESGLVGLWNFDDGTARDSSPQGHDGTLVGNAQSVEDWNPAQASLATTERLAPSQTSPSAGGKVLELDGSSNRVLRLKR